MDSAKKSRVDPGQPFGLHRDDEEEQKLEVGVQGGKGKEEGHIEVVHTDHGPGVVGAIQHREHQPHNDIGQHADAVVHSELDRTPLTLKHVADEIIHVEEEGEKDQVIAGGGDENKR